MTTYEIELQELQDQMSAELGDPRRCPRHPATKTSSNDGLFDTAGCDVCMREEDMASAQADWDAMTPEAREEELAWLALHDMHILHRDTWVPEADEILF